MCKLIDQGRLYFYHYQCSLNNLLINPHSQSFSIQSILLLFYYYIIWVPLFLLKIIHSPQRNIIIYSILLGTQNKIQYFFFFKSLFSIISTLKCEKSGNNAHTERKMTFRSFSKLYPLHSWWFIITFNCDCPIQCNASRVHKTEPNYLLITCHFLSI